jgi:hypothetical protein
MVTEYEPLVVAVIVCDVAPPGDQEYPVAAEEAKSTEPPVQKVVGPLGVIVGVAGVGFTNTFTGAEVAVQPEAFDTVTI